MVIYIEACESGSMLEDILATNINIYATTASNAEESSYACYYDDKRQTYLGDLYSVNWMEDSDAEDISKETLFKQFQITQKKTTESHVMQYGDLVRSSSHPEPSYNVQCIEPGCHTKCQRLPRHGHERQTAIDQPIGRP